MVLLTSFDFLGGARSSLNLAAAMSPAQEVAFRLANSGPSSITPERTTALIAGIAAVLVITWFAWLCLSAYRSWCAGQLRGTEAGSQVLRGLFLTMVVLLLVSW